MVGSDLGDGGAFPDRFGQLHHTDFGASQHLDTNLSPAPDHSFAAPDVPAWLNQVPTGGVQNQQNQRSNTSRGGGPPGFFTGVAESNQTFYSNQLQGGPALQFFPDSTASLQAPYNNQFQATELQPSLLGGIQETQERFINPFQPSETFPLPYEGTATQQNQPITQFQGGSQQPFQTNTFNSLGLGLSNSNTLGYNTGADASFHNTLHHGQYTQNNIQNNRFAYPNFNMSSTPVNNSEGQSKTTSSSDPYPSLSSAVSSHDKSPKAAPVEANNNTGQGMIQKETGNNGNSGFGQQPALSRGPANMNTPMARLLQYEAEAARNMNSGFGQPQGQQLSRVGVPGGLATLAFAAEAQQAYDNANIKGEPEAEQGASMFDEVEGPYYKPVPPHPMFPVQPRNNFQQPGMSQANANNMMLPPQGAQVHSRPGGTPVPSFKAESPAPSTSENDATPPPPPYPGNPNHPNYRSTLITYIQAVPAGQLSSDLLKKLNIPDDATPAERASLEADNTVISRIKAQRTREKNNIAAKKSRRNKDGKIARAERDVKKMEKQRTALLQWIHDHHGPVGVNNAVAKATRAGNQEDVIMNGSPDAGSQADQDGQPGTSNQGTSTQ